MKKSELKQYIKEIILAELTVTSDKDTVKKLADQGIGVTFDPKAKNESLFGRSEFKPLQTYKPPTTLQRFVTKGKDFLGIENKEHINKFEKLIKNLINPPYEGFVSNIKKIGGSDEMPSMVADTMMGNILVICNKKDPKIILNGEELELNDLYDECNYLKDHLVSLKNQLDSSPNIKLNESEEEPTEAEIRKEKSLAKAQTEFTKITKELKANVGKIKAIVAKKPTERTKEEETLLAKMKELTQRKNQLKTKFSKLEDED